jgi:serine phosphatase RsbU (regulator of sigma subunit)
MDIDYYKEQLEAKEDMLVRTTDYLNQIKDSLEAKNNSLSNIQHGISQSISFAKLIQTSLQPEVDVLKIFFKDADYKVAQQIGIGGDTIFIKSTNSGVVFCLLDATGHGIPGAMLSISGSLILNDITSSIEIDDPSILLKLLNYRLHQTFNNNKHSIAHFEGTAFHYCSKINRLTYSSAKGKAFLFNSNGEITSLKRTRNSVGQDQSSEFDTFELPIKKGDKLLLFSDGLIDQFGGERNKKYTVSRLKKVILRNLNKSVSELSEIIYQELLAWKGDREQTDDVSFKLIEF